MELSTWTSPDKRLNRIYVNAHPWGEAKVWIEDGADDSLRIATNAPTLTQEVEAAVTEHLKSRSGVETLPPFSALWSRCRRLEERGRRDPVFRFEHTRRLDPNRMQNPLPEPTVLHVDHREPAKLIELLRGTDNLEVVVEALDIGDYVAFDEHGEPILIVERKTVRDLQTSVTEDAKRLFRQTKNMKAASGRGVVLIEGDLYSATRLSLPSLTGTLSYLIAVQGLSVVPTLDERHTAYTIVKLLRHTAYGLGYQLSMRSSGPKDPEEAASFVLEGVPGVSAARARALLDHFGSIRAVANASADDLRQVDGVGPKTADLLVRTLGGPAG